MRTGIIGIALAACLGLAAAQDEAVPEEPAAPRATGAQAQAAADARIQLLRAELAQARDGAKRYELLQSIAREHDRVGRVGEALRTGEEIVDDELIPAGRRSLRAARAALEAVHQRDLSRGERFLGKARALSARATPEELETLPGEPAYAVLHAEAEIARRYRHRHDIALAKTQERSNLGWLRFNDTSLSPVRRRAGANELLDIVVLHAILLAQNNRRHQALAYTTELARRIREGQLPASPVQKADVEVARAIALCSNDDYDGARRVIDGAVQALVAAGVPEHNRSLGTARRIKLMVALGQGQLPAVREDAEALERARALNPVLRGSYSAREGDAMALAARGALAEAGQLMEAQVGQDEMRDGRESPFYKYRLAMRMAIQLADPAQPLATRDLMAYARRVLDDNTGEADGGTRGSYLEDAALVGTMARLVEVAGPEAPQAHALAFRVAELMRGNATQGALVDGAARLAATQPELRALIEREQAARADEVGSRSTLNAAVDANARLERRIAQQGDALVKERDQAALDRRRQQERELAQALHASGQRLVELRREIARRFPVYRDLTSGAAPEPAQIAPVLREGEVYVHLYAGVAGGVAFVVTRDGRLQALRLPVTRDQTARLAQALRASFDRGIPPQRPGDAAGFDVQASHGLYQAWIAPLQAALAGQRTVYIAAGGVLATIPWTTLLTAPRLGQDAPWWLRTATPVLLPSAQSLVLLRTHAAAQRAARPFLAFADPSFDGAAPPAAAVRRVRLAPRPADADLRGFDYRRVSRLPETLDEVRAIAASLGADDASIIHGTQATRSRVLREEMADRRVIAFATHGLVPGELPGMQKAGLAMAYEGRGLEDSILTVDDIVGLRFNADWVVLSACNTGLASGAAGDAMSALSRAFFSAGARSLAVTQWAVDSPSAVVLTTTAFQAMRARPGMTRAEALAQAQRAMIDGQKGELYRHPYFWAPYVVAGDAGS